MSTVVMTKRIADASPRVKARLAGLFQLLEAAAVSAERKYELD
jgi:hypothetical protein